MSAERSLCLSCALVRLVRGRLGQGYLLCTSSAVTAKYPPQPVVRCGAFVAEETGKNSPGVVRHGGVVRDGHPAAKSV